MFNVIVDFAMKRARGKGPELYLAAGILGGVASAILLAKAHKNRSHSVVEAVETFKTAAKETDLYAEDLEGAGAPMSRKERSRIMAPYAIMLVKEVVKVYGPSLALGAVSIACILRSHSEMKGRNEALIASAMVLTNSFAAYRERVVAKYGEAVDDEFIFGGEQRKYTTVVKDDTGGTRKVEGERVHGPETLDAGVYQRVFDAANPLWKRNGTNLFFLNAIQSELSNLLYLNDVVLLNDAYERLGFERTSYGAVAGWSRKSVGDGYISFGLGRPINADNADDDPWHLDFNVSGSVAQDIGG